MAIDIFSDYIENMNRKEERQNAASPGGGQAGAEAAAPGRPQPMDGDGSVALLREISSKLDRLSLAAGCPAVQGMPEARAYQPSPAAGAVCSAADLAVENGLVVLPGSGVFRMNVYIKDGKISHIGSGAGLLAKRTVDAAGKYVLPGIIDPHVHLGLFAPLETDLQYETKSALLGGVTTMGVFLGGPQSHLSSYPAVAEKVRQLSYTDVIPHLVIANEEQKQEIQDCVRRFGITSFKIYMNGIPGMIPSVDDGFILDVFSELKRSGRKCILCSHSENSHIVNRANGIVRAEKGAGASVSDWSDTHPAMAEEEAAVRISYLAEKSGMDVYLVHVGTKEAVARLREIKAKNKYVHVETTSPYLSITKHDTDSNLIKMEPPFREQEDVEALWRAVEDGVVDTIGTDNVSQTGAEKKVDGPMWDAVPGYPALATHLTAALHEGVIKRGIPIEKVIEKMTKNPAETFGVYPRKGTLLPGSDADLVIVDMDLEKQVRASQLWSRSDISLYEGKYMKGWPVATIKDGRLVVENSVYVGGPATGKCLERQ